MGRRGGNAGRARRTGRIMGARGDGCAGAGEGIGRMMRRLPQRVDAPRRMLWPPQVIAAEGIHAGVHGMKRRVLERGHAPKRMPSLVASASRRIFCTQVVIQ